jgi:DNA processing protein
MKDIMKQTPFYLGFNMTPGIGPARLARLSDFSGSAEAAGQARLRDLVARGLAAQSCESLMTTRARLCLDDEMARAAASTIQLICIEDPCYPVLLRQIPQPPPLLYVRGTLNPTDEWALAVVGTRSPTSYGKEATRRLVGDLASAGITIVSGLALGVDAVAHTATLEAGGRTIAVLGCGVDYLYPERNRPLAEEIMSNGALISEYPLGTLPTPANFPPRNRLISGMSCGTLVVEAGERSGALITVSFALEQGRDVFAVPGNIFSRTSAGTNRLIRDGAGLVSDAKDILEALNWTTATVQQEMQLTLPDDPVEAAVLDLLSYEPQHVDVLGRASGLTAPAVSATLAMLELKGLARQAGAMQYVRAREARAEYSIQ